ncbi:uncharacterized protein cubi_01845 [Cryptosporidium ubiquitum]|uniref:Uncharacterized protein n=1 Tax=Cryptosporidium ubiquitum TaxID=857276 RepID=A0A1J4MQP4_9CRYT|nr:uncharacterized protein cubi_01845 [Cryptosporidium ubiquitum]OII75324.1 hypothetical protein cubi_01845 [Cryptosporidium ubiquitum]
MNEIPIVLFSVKNKGNTLFFDAYSQTDSINYNSNVTPREYSNYYRFYVNKYKNYNSINVQSDQLKNSVFEQKIDLSNEKNRRCVCSSSEYIELEGNQLKNGIPITHVPRENEIDPNLNDFGTKNWQVTSYVKSQSPELNFRHSSSEIHNIRLNNSPYLYTNKNYTKYPSKQNNMGERHYNRELCRHCQYSSVKNIDFYIDPSPKYNFISNSIPEALTMTIMIGVNAVVEIIASIAVKFCARIPDKDELYPGTGCVLMDYLNDKIDHLLNDQAEIHDESTENQQSENDTKSSNINCEAWISNKLDEIMNHSNYKDSENKIPYKYNGLYDALIKNCYHKADESGFDPVKYSENLPYTLPFVSARTQTLRRGFIDYPETNS